MSHLKGVNDVPAVEANIYSHFCSYLDRVTPFFLLSFHPYFRKRNDTLTVKLKRRLSVAN